MFSTNHSQNKIIQSAITDRVNTENHFIDWEEATIIGCESDRSTRWIGEAFKLRKESQGIVKRDSPDDSATSITSFNNIQNPLPRVDGNTFCFQREREVTS